MTKLLMIADDMTGALDSGIMLQTRHFRTLVQIDADADIRDVIDCCDVVVVNTETRHLTPQEAYQRVYRIAKQALELDIPFLYKKTDSALRGNIGAELQAVLDAGNGNTVHFAPAYPQIHRTTVAGMQIINGIPLNQSSFAQDPLNPAKSAFVPEIIAAQSDVPVLLDQAPAANLPHIRVYNAQTTAQLNQIACSLLDNCTHGFFAGCAAFIGEMASYLPIASSSKNTVSVCGPLAIFCGSMHEQGKRQLETAIQHGVAHYSVDVRCAISSEYWHNAAGQSQLRQMRSHLAAGNSFLFSVLGEQGEESYPGERHEISSKLPHAIATVIEQVIDVSGIGVPMIIGGDTLGAYLAHTGVKYVSPAEEISPGVVLATYQHENQTKAFVAKAGSFGSDDLLVNMIDQFPKTTKEVV